jgi:hypothetical protein
MNLIIEKLEQERERAEVYYVIVILYWELGTKVVTFMWPESKKFT